MIALSLDVAKLRQGLTDLQQQQFPFAITKMLNDLAIRAADAERAHARQAFTIRNEGVLKYGIARTHTATKREPWTDVHIGTQRAGARAAFSYLEKFERGGRKSADASHPYGPPGDTDRTVAVPTTEVRRSRKGVVTKSGQIKSLNMKRTKGALVQGDRRAFLVRLKGKGDVAGLILQRTRRSKRRLMGPHQKGHDPSVRVLYVLKRSVPIRAVLQFVATMQQVASKHSSEAWTAALDYATRTAKPR